MVKGQNVVGCSIGYGCRSGQDRRAVTPRASTTRRHPAKRLGRVREVLRAPPARYSRSDRRHGSRFELEHRTWRFSVVGGGRAGLDAAIEAAQVGPPRPSRGEGPARRQAVPSRRIADAADSLRLPGQASRCSACTGGRHLEGGLVPVDCGNLLSRARRDVVVAAVITEQPLVFPATTSRIMFPGASAGRPRWSVSQAARRCTEGGWTTGPVNAGVLRGRASRAGGNRLRYQRPQTIDVPGPQGAGAPLFVDGRPSTATSSSCPGIPSRLQLLAHAARRSNMTSSRGIFVPTELPLVVSAWLRRRRPSGRRPFPAPSRKAGVRLCYCEDQTAKDWILDRHGFARSSSPSAHHRDDGPLPGSSATRPSGAVRESAEGQQSIGHTTAGAPGRPFRCPARPAPDYPGSSLDAPSPQAWRAGLWPGPGASPLLHADP